MALKDLTKLVEDSMVVKTEGAELVLDYDIIHEDVETVNLDQLLEEFYSEKEIVDSHKKRVDQLNNKIKDVMNARKLDDYSAGSFSAILSTQNRASLNEDSLLLKLQELGSADLIIQKDVPNVELIEEKIYNNEFNPADLSACMEYKTVQVLKVKKAKDKKVKSNG